MLTENDLRDALHNLATPQRSLLTDTIVRRGNRRRVAARSAAGAGAVSVAAVVTVSGIVLSNGSTPSSVAGQIDHQPAPDASVPATAAAAGIGLPIATGTFAPLPAASLAQSAAATRWGRRRSPRSSLRTRPAR